MKRSGNRKTSKTKVLVKVLYNLFAFVSSCAMLCFIISCISKSIGYPISVDKDSRTFAISKAEEMDADSYGNVLASEPCITVEDKYVVVYLERINDTFRQNLGYSSTGKGPVQIYNHKHLYHEMYEDYEDLPIMQVVLNDETFFDALYYKKDGKAMLRLRFDQEKAQEACTDKRTSVSIILDLKISKIL